MNSKLSERFLKSDRLLRRNAFKRVSIKGKRLQGQLIRLAIVPNRYTQARLGIRVSKKFGKAHQRNRFKRVVREAYRTCIKEKIKGHDLVISPRGTHQTIHPHQIAEEALALMEKQYS